MKPPIDPGPVISKLLAKTEEGKVPWTANTGTTFECRLDDKFRFTIARSGDEYQLVMLDASWREIFSESVEEELIYANQESRQKFETLRDLFELARRIALDVDNKIATASDLLDQI